jgi:hypothetical protein
MGSQELCGKLNRLVDSPWPVYGKGTGINPTSLSRLLEPHKIGPEHNEDRSMRGYFFQKFIETWDRKLGLPCPEHLDPGHLGRLGHDGRFGRVIGDSEDEHTRDFPPVRDTRPSRPSRPTCPTRPGERTKEEILDDLLNSPSDEYERIPVTY